MRRGVKVVVWIAAFAACAGVGAFIASKTNPFPPGVEDPGARPTPSTSPTSEPTGSAGQPWGGTASVRSYHDLFVGGRCATDWRVSLSYHVTDAGAISGKGVARLRGDLRCDFQTAQVQVETVDLGIEGRVRGRFQVLHLSVTQTSPAGGDDYGGFLRTLDRFPALRITLEAASARKVIEVPDADQGTFGAAYRVDTGCLTC